LKSFPAPDRSSRSTRPTPTPRRFGNILLYTASFRNGQGAPVIVETGQSDQFSRTVQKRLATSLFIGLPILLLAAALAGYFLMRQALNPVEAMINAAETYTFNDPHNRLPLIGTEPRIEALGLALDVQPDQRQHGDHRQGRDEAAEPVGARSGFRYQDDDAGSDEIFDDDPGHDPASVTKPSAVRPFRMYDLYRAVTNPYA